MPSKKTTSKDLERFNLIFSKGILITMDDDLKTIQEGRLFEFPVISIPSKPSIPPKEIKTAEKIEKIKEEISKIKEKEEKEKEIEEIKKKEEEIRQKILQEKQREKEIVEEIKRRAKEEEERKEKEIVEKIRKIALEKKKEEEKKQELAEQKRREMLTQKERKIIEKIREEARKREEIEKEIMTQRLKDSLLRTKLKLESELAELKQNKISLEKIQNNLSQNVVAAESALKEILSQEKEIEVKYQELEDIESKSQTIEERRKYEQQRWELSKQRRKIEQQKWLKNDEFEKAKKIYDENLNKIKELQTKIDENQNRLLEIEDKLQELDLQKQKDALNNNLGLLRKNLFEIQTLITENLKKHAEIEEKLQKIRERESEIEKQEKEIERKEKTTLSVKEQKEIEKQRWQIEDEREEIEKQRWQIEENLATLDKKNVALEEEKIKLEENIKNITAQIEEIDILLEYGVKKGKEILAAKKAGLSLKKLKVKEEPKTEKKVIVIHEKPVTAKIEEKISEIEKEKYESELEKEKLKIEEEKKKALEEKKRIELERKQIEFEKKRLDELKRMVQEKEINVKEHILSPKEKIVEMLTKVSPEEELKRKEFLAKVAGKPVAAKEEQKEVIFKPMAIAKPSFAEKIIIRIFIVLLLAGIAVGIYLLYHTYIFPWQKKSTLPEIVNPLETSQENVVSNSAQIETTTQNISQTSTQENQNITTTSIEAPSFLFNANETKIFAFENLTDVYNEFLQWLSDIKGMKEETTTQRVLFFNKNSQQFSGLLDIFSILNIKFTTPVFSENSFSQTDLIFVKEKTFISLMIFAKVTDKKIILQQVAAWEKTMKDDLLPLYRLLYDENIKFSGSFKTSQAPYKLRYLDSNLPNVGICYTLFSPNSQDYYLILSTSGKALVDILNKLIITM